MSEFKTIDQIAREHATQQTSPLTMGALADMLEGNPLQFEDQGRVYQIPLGQDVKMVFTGLTKLAAKVEDVPKDDRAAVLASRYAREVAQLNEEKEATANGDGNKRQAGSLPEHQSPAD